MIVCCSFSTTGHAQTPLQLGSVGSVTAAPPGSCDSSNGWYAYGSNSLNCYTATVSGCPNADRWGLTFGYLNPAAIQPPLVSNALGTIVMFIGDGGVQSALSGTTPFADAYFKAGYEIVEFAWNDDWEYTSDPIPPNTYGNILNAACRPATFLNYVYTTYFLGAINNQSNPNTGFCAHATSAGSAAVAYSLAYYGAGSWLDNVEMISGPVFSDIKQGCEEPAPNPVTVCGLNGGMQLGCQLGGGGTWTLSPSYIGVNGQVGLWTGDRTCSNLWPVATSSASNASWLGQSIVNQSTGGQGQPPVPTFSYPGTAMSAWLCRSVASGFGQPNNSSPQGQIFYAQAGATGPQQPYAIYAVDGCHYSEEVGDGNVPGYQPGIFNGHVNGLTAVPDDMIGIPPNIPAQCVRRSH